MTYQEITKQFVLTHASEAEFNNLEKYVQMIEEQNKTMNLTGFSKDRLWQEGIYESIISLFQVFNNPESKSLLDIGAGAGFPSVPFKIVFPKLNLTIIEPQQKRVNFLQAVSKELNLNINLIVTRAEDFKGDTFDLITARAVAPLYALLEISSHLGRLESHYAFLKGPSLPEEVNEAKGIIDQLKIDYNIKKLDDKNIERESLIFTYIKKSPTPKELPRPWIKIIAK